MKMRVFMDRNPNRECDKTKKETSILLISWCGGITDYRTFMEDFRKCAEFVKWLKEKTEG